MANYNRDWEDLGRSVQNIVEQAINSRDYDQLNQTIRQVVGRAVDLGSEAVRKAIDASSRPEQRAAEEVRPPVSERKNLPALYGSTSGQTTKGLVKVVGGGLVSGFAFMGMLASVAFDLMFYGPGPRHGSMGLGVVGLAAGVVLAFSGIRNLQKVKRFKIYRQTLGQKTHCTLEKLARSVGKSVKFVRRELQQMIHEGLFLQGHMDNEETRLITSDETYQQFEQSRLQLEQRQHQEAAAAAKKAESSHTPQVQEVLDRGDAYIAQIRRCNDAIPGEAISEKISRIELTVQHIFDRAEAHPEIIPDLKKMMDYYLPMTVKLLNAYADMDAQPIQGETIINSKREIEATLDTLNLAFEKLLDDLFRDTALDVSSDISVLNTMLAQEGLTEDDLSKLKRQRNG